MVEIVAYRRVLLALPAGLLVIVGCSTQSGSQAPKTVVVTRTATAPATSASPSPTGSGAPNSPTASASTMRQLPGTCDDLLPAASVDNALGRWFGGGRDFFGDGGSLAPYGVDIRDDKDHLIVEAELPGFKKEEIDISLENGTLSIQLGPIIERVKERLQEQGIGFASAIPVIDRSIVIAKADSLVLVQTLYSLAVAVGTWLPFIVLILLIAGVLVAKRRSAALVWTAGGLALTMLITLAGLGTARLFFVSTVSPSIMPAATVSLL